MPSPATSSRPVRPGAAHDEDAALDRPSMNSACASQPACSSGRPLSQAGTDPTRTTTHGIRSGMTPAPRNRTLAGRRRQSCSASCGSARAARVATRAGSCSPPGTTGSTPGFVLGCSASTSATTARWPWIRFLRRLQRPAGGPSARPRGAVRRRGQRPRRSSRDRRSPRRRAAVVSALRRNPERRRRPRRHSPIRARPEPPRLRGRISLAALEDDSRMFDRAGRPCSCRRSWAKA